MKKPTVNIKLNGEKNENFSPKTRNREHMFTFPTSIPNFTGGAKYSNKARK